MKLSTDAEIKALLESTHTIAMVGLSNKPNRPSYGVAQYLLAHGYHIVAVNPALHGEPVLGCASYNTLGVAQQALQADGKQIDMVDVFRRSEEVAAIAQEAMIIGAKSLWLQLDISDPEAEAQAADAGLSVVVNHCTKIEHRRLLLGARLNIAPPTPP